MDQINALVAAGLSVHFVDNGDFKHRCTCRISHKDGTSGVVGQGKDAAEALGVALQSARSAGLIAGGEKELQTVSAADIQTVDAAIAPPPPPSK